MENVIYNELCMRGNSVDVGCVEDVSLNAQHKKEQRQVEIDFVCNLGSKKIYVQSALSLPSLEKINQEQRPLLKIKDSFPRLIIVKDGITHYNDEGILILNLFDFLMKRTEGVCTI